MHVRRARHGQGLAEGVHSLAKKSKKKRKERSRVGLTITDASLNRFRRGRPMFVARGLIALSAAVELLVASANNAVAQKKYDPGVSDTEIKIGNIMPYS